MESEEIGRRVKRVHTLAMVNVGIWVISIVALVVLLEGNGNLRGLYVVLGGGTAVALQLLSLTSKWR